MNIIEETIDLLEAPTNYTPDWETIRWHFLAFLEDENKQIIPAKATLDICETIIDSFHNDMTARLKP